MADLPLKELKKKRQFLILYEETATGSRGYSATNATAGNVGGYPKQTNAAAILSRRRASWSES